MLDLDRQPVDSFVLRKFLAKDILLADQNDLDAERSGGTNGPRAATHQIRVQAEHGTDIAAIFAADPLQRQREQNILPQNIFQLEAASLIEGDLGFPFVDLDFITKVRFQRGPVEEIEIRIDR